MAGFNLNFNQATMNNRLQQPTQFSAIPTANIAGQTQPYQADWLTRMKQWGSDVTGEGGFLSLDSMFGGEGTTGWVSPALQGIGSVMGGWNAMQQLDLAKEQFAFQKEAYATNLANQTQLTNQAITDREKARQAAYGNQNWSADEQWKRQNLLPANK